MQPPSLSLTAMLASMLASTLAASTLVFLPSLAVTRGQSIGEYVDDAAITAMVTTNFIENKALRATAVTVAKLQRDFKVSDFAMSSQEREDTAQPLAQGEGLKHVSNAIVVRQ